MKKLILAISAIIIMFAILLPLASKTPDGVQNLVATNGTKQQQPVWNGIMANYSVAIGNQYISTLCAGLLGIGFIMASCLALSIAIAPRKKKVISKKNIQ